MIKRSISMFGLLLVISGCTDSVSLIQRQTHTGNQDIAVSVTQQDFVYHKIVHNWRKISKNSKVPLPYTARVELLYTPDGQLRFSHFETLSGSPEFDQELDRAIQMSGNLGTELAQALETTLTFHHADMVRRNHHYHH